MSNTLYLIEGRHGAFVEATIDLVEAEELRWQVGDGGPMRLYSVPLVDVFNMLWRDGAAPLRLVREA